MPLIECRSKELRIVDTNVTWKLRYGTASDAVIIAEIYKHQTNQTPKARSKPQRRLREYDDA